MAMDQNWDKVIVLVDEIARRYQLSALEPLLASCRAAAAQEEISIAVLGRFKVGKSSFMNHLFRCALLPVGVIPVTAVVSEIYYGVKEKAVVHFLDGRSEQVPVNAIRQFIAESENPDNAKRVATVKVELPTLESLRGLRFVDTPGLESSLAHNTEASLKWLPNVGLALVAVSADHPLSQPDIELLKSLRQYTPAISILLTKADLLSEAECAEVIGFMQEQLNRTFDVTPKIFPYSVRPGYERYRAQLEERLLSGTLVGFHQQRRAIIERKLETLISECTDYLTLALKATKAIESERDALQRQVLGEQTATEEAKSEIRLVVQHAAGGARVAIAQRLSRHQAELEALLREALQTEFPNWTQSLAFALQSYETWLQRSLGGELSVISGLHRAEFLAPVKQVRRQVFHRLQSFRDELSERAVRAFGAPLRTTEVEIEVAEPSSPDIRIGKVFDTSWESFSAIIPMWLMKGVIASHFRKRLAWMVEKNLSRLATQWAESCNAALTQIQREATGRLDELQATVARLLANSADHAPQLSADLAYLNSALQLLISSSNEVAEKRSETEAIVDAGRMK
jgi:GTP-binding protein EngB required for normal cell division